MSSRFRIVAVVAVALLVAAAAGAFVLQRGETAGGTSQVEALTGQPFQPPDSENLVQVDNSRVRVEASSYLQPAGGITYAPSNLVDGDLTTAWNSDAAPDQGRGQTITFRFAEPVDLRSVSFINGYAKNADIYDANHRVQDLIITTDEISEELSLFDSSDEQNIVFEFGFTSKLVVEVVDIYPGLGFTDPALTADLALTEVVFVAVES